MWLADSSMISRYFPPFIDNDLGVGTTLAVLADQKVVVIRRQAIAPVAVFLADLISQIDLVRSEERRVGKECG